MSDRFPQLFWGLIALSLALVLGSLAGASALRDFHRTDEIQATGSARRPVRSDYIVWRGQVTVQGPTLADAYDQWRRHTNRVRGYLAEHGVADSTVTFRAVETYAIPETLENGRETGRVLGYRLGQMFEVRSSDVEGIARVAEQSSELIREGVPLMAFSPEYLFTGLADIRTELLAEATKDASDRAAAIAESAGGKIGTVRSARMGVFQITPRYSTEVSDYGINDTSSLEKDVTAVVRVTFSVK
ncbi:MAG TPA: SIMPL domain-containing protein [Longimicrobiaceae bacterium]|nr:SIMPL domain-containing protein [Longimicrobiaceae bacterium]